ncbi:L,D-transpeptidase [Gordonia shandongensis]|uniref:L,D-transpeptidase n=1 Tax=Gordonia shandongensis TaxID=376351 RepID=UPI003CCBAC2C
MLMVAACASDAPDAAPPPPATISVPVADGAPINPTTPIVVDARGGELTAVTVTNADGKRVDGTADREGTRWTTTEDLGYDHTYTVSATAANADGHRTRKTFTVSTLAPKSTAYANVIPAPETVSDVGIGIGQPMVFQFTEPVANKAEVTKHLKVTTTPAQPGSWYWIDDQNVHYRGPHYWKPGTRIHLEADVYGVDLGNGVYGAEDNAVDYTVHDSWVAEADGATELLTVFHNGEQVRQMPMSLGEPDTPSHTGPHVISEKSPVTVMDSCSFGVCQGDPGYYRETVYNDLRISNDGEFVHAAPWSVGQQGAANVSHGCVNLSNADAKWMFDHFGIGDVVEVTDSGGPPLPVWDTYGDWELSWEQWKAGAPT